MVIDSKGSGERAARIDRLIREFRIAEQRNAQRRAMRRAMRSWLRAEARQQIVNLETPPERVH